MLFIFFFVISILLSITLLRRREIYLFFETYRLAKIIQGPPLCPFIGSLQFLNKDAVEAYTLGQRYGKTYANGFRLWLLGKLIYMSYNADAVEAIVTNKKNNPKSFTYQFLHQFLGEGLLLSSGQKWFERRKILTPAFHFNMLRKYLPSIKHQTKVLIKLLMNEELNNPNGTNLQAVVSRFTLNTICETAMGVSLTKPNELDEYRAQIHEYGNVHVERIFKFWLHSDVLYKLFGKEQEERKITSKVHKFTGELISSRRKAQNNGIRYDDTFGKKRHAMLDTLLIAENNGQISAAGIQEEVDTFVFEGYDTTMTAITFTLFMISHHSDVQRRLYEEIKAFYDGCDNDDRYLDVNQYNELKYLECVIKESLRLYPPVPVIGRVLGDDTKIDGINLPSGTTVNILINLLHRNPIYFPNPDTFDPSRFTVENSRNRHPFAYIPFSASFRNCIGQKFAMLELKMVISEILNNFYLEPVTKVEELIFKSDMTLKSLEPVRIRFLSRGLYF